MEPVRSAGNAVSGQRRSPKLPNFPGAAGPPGGLTATPDSQLLCDSTIRRRTRLLKNFAGIAFSFAGIAFSFAGIAGGKLKPCYNTFVSAVYVSNDDVNYIACRIF